MAIFKQGQLNQVLAVMVDKTDFASVESGVTSGFTCTLYTYKQNASTATSATTLSRAPSVVRSGIFRITMKAADTSGVDCALLKIAHASCADQYIPINFQVQDLSDFISNVDSAVSSQYTKAYSAINQTNSRVLLTQSIVSDAYSMLSDFYSDFVSKVPKAPATASRLLLLESVASDTHSAATKGNSMLLVAQSFLSDIDSAVSSQFARTSDYLSDLLSVVTVTGVQLNASSFSDIRSAITAGGAAISDSNISDIASAVWANTIGARVDSRILVAQSFLSDIRSNLSDLQSDFQSRVPKLVATNSQVSDLASDIRSYLVGISGAISDVDSQVNLNASALDDVKGRTSRLLSNVSDIDSALTSQFVAGHPMNASDMSDIRSAILSLSDAISNAYSAAVVGSSRAGLAASRALLNQSMLSDIDSALTSQYTAGHPLTSSDMSDLRSVMGAITVTLTASDISDIASATAAAVTAVTASDISDIASAVWSYGTRKITSLADVSLCASDMSDIRSAITAGGGAISDSNISDIASAVWANAVGTRVDSRVTKVLSDTSNIYSLLGAGIPMMASDMSDIRSAITAKTFDISASDMSDIRSVVLSLSDAISNAYSAAVVGASRAGVAASRALVNQSMISDVDSALSSQFAKSQSDISDIYSLLTGISDQISNVDSAVSSQFTALTATTSNINSVITAQIGEMTQGIPPATPTPMQALMYLYMAWRNETNTTATTLSIKNDAGVVIAKATLSDDATTFVKAEFVSGA